MLAQLDLLRRFTGQIPIPNVNTQQELVKIMRHTGAFADHEISQALHEISQQTGSSDIGVGIKSVLMGIDTAKQDQDVAAGFAEVISNSIAATRVIGDT